MTDTDRSPYADRLERMQAHTTKKALAWMDERARALLAEITGGDGDPTDDATWQRAREIWRERTAAPADTARPDLDAIAAREQAASLEVHRLCNGGRWTMRVPARDDADSDMVISRSLSDIDVLTAEVRRLTALLETARTHHANSWGDDATCAETDQAWQDAARDAVAAALAAHSNAATELGNYRSAEAFAHADRIRALPDEGTPAADACANCGTAFVTNTSFNGHARHKATQWCRRCVDRCHEASADHKCPICTTEES